MTVSIRTTLRPIETLYRGYRFRSRLEARRAVFFDAAGIKWSYEDQGYKLNGRGYLPDFWLPQLEIFVETKPDDEACKQAMPMLRALVAATGDRAVLIGGAPNVGDPPAMTRILRDARAQEKTWIAREFWEQCPFCSSVHLGGFYSDLCNRVPAVKMLRRPRERGPGPWLKHAMQEAQQARFEHGEDGRPRPYVADTPTAIESVYVAGAVLGERPFEWEERGKIQVSTETYELPWIPIFVAFLNEGLRVQYYFAQQLATVAVIAPNALAVWRIFVAWRNHEAISPNDGEDDA